MYFLSLGVKGLKEMLCSGDTTAERLRYLQNAHPSGSRYCRIMKGALVYRRGDTIDAGSRIEGQMTDHCSDSARSPLLFRF